MEDTRRRPLLHVAALTEPVVTHGRGEGRAVGVVVGGRHRLHGEARRRPCRTARALSLADGIVRARYRDSTRQRSAPLEPGVPTLFSIDLWDLAHTFLPGHRIRLEISSSNFPRFDRNTNTGNELGQDGADDVAHGDAAGLPRRGAPERARADGRDRTRGRR